MKLQHDKSLTNGIQWYTCEITDKDIADEERSEYFESFVKSWINDDMSLVRMPTNSSAEYELRANNFENNSYLNFEMVLQDASEREERVQWLLYQVRVI